MARQGTGWDIGSAEELTLPVKVSDWSIVVATAVCCCGLQPAAQERTEDRHANGNRIREEMQPGRNEMRGWGE